MTRWSAARLVVGVAIVATLVWRVGPAPFRDAAAQLGPTTLLLGLALGVPTTICCAWRWSLVAGALGVRLPLREAVAAVYRAQLLNVAVPGGVAGDVHRGYRQGRDTGDTVRGLRAVAWERAAGQVVLVAVTSSVLVATSSTARGRLPLLALLALAGAAVLAVRARPPRGARWWARGLRVLHQDLHGGLYGGLHGGLLSLRTCTGVLAASVGALAGPLVTFLVAAHVAGVTASPAELVRLGLVALLAMAVPLGVAGWGPREGVAAWSFAAAGLGADAGVTTAVVYGVMAVVAVLPGAVVIATGARRTVPAVPPPMTRDRELTRG